MKKYNVANNAFATLELPLGDSDTSMVLTGTYNTLPTSNFIVKITHKNGEKVEYRENIYVATRNGSTCTGLLRAYEKVPMNDTSNSQIKQAFNFEAGDVVECVVSSKIIEDTQLGAFEVQMKKAVNIVPSSGNDVWVNLGRLHGEASRLSVSIMGGAGFNTNSNGQVSHQVIALQIGNGIGERNLSGYWCSFFSGNIVQEVRVKKINTYDFDIFLKIKAYSTNSFYDIKYSGDFTIKNIIENEPALSGDVVYVISEKSLGPNADELVRIGRFTQTGEMAVQVNGTASTPVPIVYCKRLYIQLRAKHQNRNFHHSGGNANEQCVINNGKYPMTLKKIHYDQMNSTQLYIQEGSSSANKILLGNASGTSLDCNFNLKANTKYIITGFTMTSYSGNQNGEITQPIAGYSIARGVNNLLALEFDMGGKFYPSEANSMYHCLAGCDGFVTKTINAGEMVTSGFFDNFYIQGVLSSMQIGNNVFVGNSQGLLSTTKGTISSMVGEKKTNGLLVKRKNIGSVCVSLSGNTQYSDSSWSSSSGTDKYYGFFPGGDAHIYMRLSGYGVNLVIRYYGIDGSYNEWRRNHSSGSSNPVTTELSLNTNLGPGTFVICVDSMSNSSGINASVTY